MTGALRYEVMRIRTIPSSYWLAGIAITITVGITLLLCWAVASGDELQAEFAGPEVTLWVVTGGATFAVMPVLAAALSAVIGAMSIGHEYRYGTNKATLTAIPDRVAVLAAKILVLTAWVTAIVVTILLINLFFVWLFVSDPELGSGVVRPLVNYWGYCVGFALAGFALSMIFRHQTGAVVAVLLWPFVLEPIINAVLTAIGEQSQAGLRELTNLLPASAGRRSMFYPYVDFAGFGEFDTWGVGASTLVFWVGVLILVGTGATLFIKRDA